MESKRELGLPSPASGRRGLIAGLFDLLFDLVAQGRVLLQLVEQFVEAGAVEAGAAETAAATAAALGGPGHANRCLRDIGDEVGVLGLLRQRLDGVVARHFRE